MYTYKQLKDEVFKLLFNYSNKGVLTLNNASNKDAMLAFGEAVNFALVDVSEVMPRICQYSIVKNVPPLCVSAPEALRAFGVRQHINDDITKEFHGAYSYYFEVKGKATIQIASNGKILETIINVNGDGYSAYKSHTRYNDIDYTDITITFKGDCFFCFRNVMCYGVRFESDEQIIPYTDYIKYNLRKKIAKARGYDAFLRVTKDRPFVMRGSFCDNNRYKENFPYFLEGKENLLLNYFDSGEIIVNYVQNPKLISVTTLDDYDLEELLPIEALRIIPYLIAYRVGLDDEEEKATMYFNLYEQKKAELINANVCEQQEYFTSESGF